MAAYDKKQMDAMVNRFLMWKLPESFGPDCFVKFDRERAKANQSWPVGTNLLNADEARAMLEHVLDVTFIPDWSLLEATQASLREHMKMVSELRRQLAAAPAPAVEAVSLPADCFAVNFMRLAGLDKHKARECEAIVRQVLDVSTRNEGGEAADHGS